MRHAFGFQAGAYHGMGWIGFTSKHLTFQQLTFSRQLRTSRKIDGERCLTRTDDKLHHQIPCVEAAPLAIAIPIVLMIDRQSKPIPIENLSQRCLYRV
jgi:hypothetical protein